MNTAVQPRAPNVPNPHTILSQVPPTAMHFTVVDLSNAFFSVPVHPDSQFWFAFQFNGKSYTFTRLPQGYCESPTIYNESLAASLSGLELSPGSVLLQYVDDLLLPLPLRSSARWTPSASYATSLQKVIKRYRGLRPSHLTGSSCSFSHSQ